MKTRKISIDFKETTLDKMDAERKKKNFSRSKLIDYLIKKWFKDDCKIIMED